MIDKLKIQISKTNAGDASLMCLGLTAGGYPRHPLYVPANTEDDAPMRGKPYDDGENVLVRFHRVAAETAAAHKLLLAPEDGLGI